MRPFVLGFLCSCFVVSQAVYTLFGRDDPTALVSAGPTLVWVFLAPLAILKSPLDDHSLRRSIVSCSVAGLCFVTLIGATALVAVVVPGLDAERPVFGAILIGTGLVGIPLSVGLVSLFDVGLRALNGE